MPKSLHNTLLTTLALLLLIATPVATTAQAITLNGTATLPQVEAGSDPTGPSTADGNSAPGSTASLCNRGDEQSPINIDTVYPYLLDYRKNTAYPTRITAPRLRFVMFPTPLDLTREADGIRVHVTSGSYTRVNRERYELEDIRFRTPSEHLINGHRYPAEIQFLHHHDNALAIFSIFVEEGSSANPVLTEILNNAPHLVGETNSFRRRRIDTALLLPGSKGFFTYSGSLSSPPCTEQVRRFVMKDPIRASREQLLALRGLAGDNARPIQAIGERMVLQTSY